MGKSGSNAPPRPLKKDFVFTSGSNFNRICASGVMRLSPLKDNHSVQECTPEQSTKDLKLLPELRHNILGRTFGPTMDDEYKMSQNKYASAELRGRINPWRENKAETLADQFKQDIDKLIDLRKEFRDMKLEDKVTQMQ